MKFKMLLPLLLLAFFCVGCDVPVLKQDIPVSTDPIGAKMYVDGQYAGDTPGSVSLERAKDHMLTLIKENYNQVDVPITRKYQKEQVIMNAVNRGLQDGVFFNNTAMGVNSGVNSINYQKQTGEAYVLEPSYVKVKLYPAGTPQPEYKPDTQTQTSAPAGQQTSTTQGQSDTDSKYLVKEGLKIGAAAALSNAQPVEKKQEISSSHKTYQKSDGTVVTKSSSTSVSVGFNPAGLVNVIDKLFQ